MCSMCESGSGTLEHILAACSARRGMYMGRHNLVHAVQRKGWLLQTVSNERTNEDDEEYD